jgi:hypothetical protein
MKAKLNNNDDTWLQILIGVIAVLALKSIFENDRSKIVSKKGQKILNDDKKMEEIHKRREKMESSGSQREILI